MYFIEGEDPYLYDWIAQEDDLALIETVIDWLPVFAGDPHEHRTAIRIRKGGLACMTARVPDTDVFIDYTLIEDPKVIVLLGVDSRGMFLG